MTNDTSADWKAMYMLLFHGITDALELLPARLENAPACEVLSKALRDAEEFVQQLRDVGALEE